MRFSAVLLAAGVALAPVAASASSVFTYNFDFRFDVSGDNVGGLRVEGPGGQVDGFFTIDENSQILDFDFTMEVIQRANRFQPDRTDIVSLDIDEGDAFGSSNARNGQFSQDFNRTFSFAETVGSVNCGTTILRPFTLSFRELNFVPGTDNVVFDFVSGNRSSGFVCNGFGGGRPGFGQSAGQLQRSSNSVVGTLGVPGGSGAPGTPGVIPLPATGVLLLGALGAAAALRRRKAV